MEQDEERAASRSALDGIKVVDVAQVWAAPGAGMYLADQGAEVIG